MCPSPRQSSLSPSATGSVGLLIGTFLFAVSNTLAKTIYFRGVSLATLFLIRGVVVYARVNVTPSRASESMFGESPCAAPYAPCALRGMSSETARTMFGGADGSVFGDAAPKALSPESMSGF